MLYGRETFAAANSPSWDSPSPAAARLHLGLARGDPKGTLEHVEGGLWLSQLGGVAAIQ